MRLYCIPGGAASATIYMRWSKYLAQQVKLGLLEIAGRGMRYKESSMDTMDEVADDLFAALQTSMADHNDDAYMILGYCFGSIAAYEVYRRIVDAGLPEPLHMFFCASDPPNGNTYASSLFSNRQRGEEIEETLMRYFPPHVFEDKQRVRDFCKRFTDLTFANYERYGQVLPITTKMIYGDGGDGPDQNFEFDKALEFANHTLSLFDIDQRIVQDYQTLGRDFIPVHCEMTVFAGSDDTMTPLAAVSRWGDFAAKSFNLEVIDGGHLILLDGYLQCIEYINMLATRYYQGISNAAEYFASGVET
jgi:surfactin synthase thioesterase subunit